MKIRQDEVVFRIILNDSACAKAFHVTNRESGGKWKMTDDAKPLQKRVCYSEPMAPKWNAWFHNGESHRLVSVTPVNPGSFLHALVGSVHLHSNCNWLLKFTWLRCVAVYDFFFVSLKFKLLKLYGYNSKIEPLRKLSTLMVSCTFLRYFIGYVKCTLS